MFLLLFTTKNKVFFIQGIIKFKPFTQNNIKLQIKEGVFYFMQWGLSRQSHCRRWTYLDCCSRALRYASSVSSASLVFWLIWANKNWHLASSIIFGKTFAIIKERNRRNSSQNFRMKWITRKSILLKSTRPAKLLMFNISKSLYQKGTEQLSRALTIFARCEIFSWHSSEYLCLIKSVLSKNNLDSLIVSRRPSNFQWIKKSYRFSFWN